MWNCVRGAVHRRNILMLSFLIYAGFFLLLRFQGCVIQVTPPEIRRNVQPGVRSSPHEGETLTIGGGRSQGRIRDRTFYNDFDNVKRIESRFRKHINASYSRTHTRETAERKAPWCKVAKEESKLREIQRGTLIYSAWYDDRETQRFVRVLLLTSTRDPLPLLFCHFNTTSKQGTLSSRASLYQHSGNHYMRFGCFIASCALPPELDNIPCFVNISLRSTSETHNNSGSVILSVGSISKRQYSIEKESHRQYGICIPPLHGEISVDRLIEFLELSQILGASNFTFYNLEVSDSVQNVLDYYEDKGVVRVLPWNLPPYIGKYDIHYFGQILSIMDCLFRSMSDLDFVAFNDLDEFIVPLYHDNMSVLLEDIHREEHCGHCFDSVTFDPSWEDLKLSPLLTQRVFHRTKKPTPFWGKCIVDPQKIFEQGIHHIVRPIQDNYIANNVDWRVARVFHYRHCNDSQALMHCSKFEEDKTMWMYENRLQRHFETNRISVANMSRG